MVAIPFGINKSKQFSTESECEHIMQRAIHRSGNALDLLFTDASATDASNMGLPVETSDHCFISAY